MRPSLVLVLNDLTSLQVRAGEFCDSELRREGATHRHKSATRSAAPATTMMRGEPVALGILASVLHAVGSAAQRFSHQCESAQAETVEGSTHPLS